MLSIRRLAHQGKAAGQLRGGGGDRQVEGTHTMDKRPLTTLRIIPGVFGSVLQRRNGVIPTQIAIVKPPPELRHTNIALVSLA